MLDLGVPTWRHEEHDLLIKKLDVPDGLEEVLPVPNPTQSFWLNIPADTEFDLAKYGSTGQLSEDADICIIGSGSSGISTVYHLTRLLKESGRTGLKIVLLEARDFCSGATGRNGGHLTPTSFSEFASVEKRYGTEEALTNAALEEYVTSEIKALSQKHDWSKDIDLVTNKCTVLLVTDEDKEKTRLDFQKAKEAGLPFIDQVEWLEAEEVNERFGTPYPAVRKPGNNVWPYKLFTKLYKLALSQSGPEVEVSLHTSTPATSISEVHLTSADTNQASPRRWKVETPRGSLTCSFVIHATNGYASHLLPHLRGSKGIIPTRGQMIATRASAPSHLITDSAWVANSTFEYWFPRPTSTPEDPPLIILGGAQEILTNFEFYQIDDSVVTDEVGKALRKFLPRLFPGKFEEHTESENEWTGILGYTSTGTPFVGPVVDPLEPNSKKFEGQYITAGFHGHGMPRTFACAKAIAEMVTAEINGKFDQWERPQWLPKYYLTTYEHRHDI